MAGKVISKANAAHVQAAHDSLTKLGAQCGGSAKRLAAKAAADMSVFDLIDCLRRAVLDNVSAAEIQDYEYYPHLEDIYPDSLTCIIEIGDVYWQAGYTVDAAGCATLAARDTWVQVTEVWQPVEAAAKAGALPVSTEPAEMTATMKAAGDRLIDVRIAFGGPASKDAHGEYFSAKTDFAEADFPTPPLIYYHGFDQGTNRAMSKPIVIGTPLKRWSDADGHYIRYQLKDNQYADLTWNDAKTGETPASPGTVSYLIRKAANGELLYWPVAEVSAWDRAGGRKQAYRRTVATAALKALYAEAGLSLPAVLDTDAPEAAGDAAAGEAGPTVDATTAGRIIAAVVAAALTSKG